MWVFLLINVALIKELSVAIILKQMNYYFRLKVNNAWQYDVLIWGGQKYEIYIWQDLKEKVNKATKIK